MSTNSDTKAADRQLMILLLVVAVGFIGIAMPFPIFAPLFLHPEHGTIVPFGWHESTRSLFLGVVLAIYPLGQFYGSPVIGSLSDKYGRKPVLVITLIVTTLGYLLTALAVAQNQLWLLIASRFFNGFSEGNIALARAIAADMPGLDKYKSFGRIGGAATIGYILGPIMGGLLADNKVVSWFNFSLPFYAAAGISLIALLLCCLFLRESRRTKDTKPISILEELRFIKRIKRLADNPLLWVLLVTAFFMTMGSDIYYQFYPVYLVAKWQMTPFDIAIYTAVLGVTIGITDSWIVYRVAQRYPNRKVVLTMGSAYILTLVAMMWTSHANYLYLLFALTGIFIAFITTMVAVRVSETASDDIQGEVMGVLWATRTFGDAMICLFGGVLIAFSYQLPFIMAILFVLIALWLLPRK